MEEHDPFEGKSSPYEVFRSHVGLQGEYGTQKHPLHSLDEGKSYTYQVVITPREGPLIDLNVEMEKTAKISEMLTKVQQLLVQRGVRIRKLEIETPLATPSVTTFHQWGPDDVVGECVKDPRVQSFFFSAAVDVNVASVDTRWTDMDDAMDPMNIDHVESKLPVNTQDGKQSLAEAPLKAEESMDIDNTDSATVHLPGSATTNTEHAEFDANLKTKQTAAKAKGGKTLVNGNSTSKVSRQPRKNAANKVKSSSLHNDLLDDDDDDEMAPRQSIYNEWATTTDTPATESSIGEREIKPETHNAIVEASSPPLTAPTGEAQSSSVQHQNADTEEGNRRSGRKHKAIKAEIHDGDSDYAPATLDERSEWKGFSETESEPVIFNTILEKLGTRHWEVQEIYDLDELQVRDFSLISGLVFLYQIPDEDEASLMDSDRSRKVWFANQVSGNACATMAILNIVMNAKGRAGIDHLGDELRAFKAATATMSAADRGNAIAETPLIRAAHNAFARRIDMLDSDLQLEDNAATHEKKKAKKSKSNSGKKGKNKNYGHVYHFVAYIPDRKGNIWMLDGYNTAPHRVGTFEIDPGSDNLQSWKSVLPSINDRMAKLANGGIAFNLLALCEDRLLLPRIQIAAQHFKIQQLEHQLANHSKKGGHMSRNKYKRYHPIENDTSNGDELVVELKDFDWVAPVHITTPNPVYGLTDEIWRAGEQIALQELTANTPSDVTTEDLIVARFAAYQAQEHYIKTINEGQGTQQQNQTEATDKQRDYGPAIHAWTGNSSDGGTLKKTPKKVR